ncbi:S8 family peptidase [Streptomyces ipomoeae]|uniref:S8 family peptidase n=1 Tax=Streptomyces ipomoeae TaxID=103232 RepID=UPI001146E92A|nr:S8 family serine peptidase [Streptomyces ipomoeae]MDX2935456.1 S8 family serine peptidase [Streptomyces ipomoeae]TQE28062.1 serine protease [Streptomyces ipomoeae]
MTGTNTTLRPCGTVARRTAALVASTVCLATLSLSGTALAAPRAATETVPQSWEYQALNLAEAQQAAQGEGVTVAVLDSGVEADHPALAGKVTTGPDYVDDGLKPGDPKWGDHGTAMASDVLKVAPKAEILSVRITNGDEESFYRGTSVIARGIDYAIEHGADVISMSIGGELLGDSYDEEEADALGRAAQAGIPVLASAGNSGDEFNEAQYPAGYPGVIAVAALQQNGTRAEFSTVRTYNSVAAPGVAIMSAKNTGGYEPINGTSPATALTAGVVALMKSENPDLTSAQVRSILTTTAGHASLGPSPLDGYGEIDAAAAVEAAAKPPADRTVPVAYKGEEHLATPDGTPKTKHPALQTDLVTIGGGAAAVGLVMLIGSLLLARASRRRARAAAA